jgi:hypothetical protein
MPVAEYAIRIDYRTYTRLKLSYSEEGSALAVSVFLVIVRRVIILFKIGSVIEINCNSFEDWLESNGQLMQGGVRRLRDGEQSGRNLSEKGSAR